jgi:hypothetical protein
MGRDQAMHVSKNVPGRRDQLTVSEMPQEDEDLARAIAYAMWKSPHRRADPTKLENCRLVAADVVKHLHRAAYKVGRAETPAFGAAHLARPAPSEREPDGGG